MAKLVEEMADKFPNKYVVIFECDTGYMDCVAICDKSAEAYGEAYLALSEGLEEDSYYITLPERREGENGYIMEVIDKNTGKVINWCTVLFYREEKDD